MINEKQRSEIVNTLPNDFEKRSYRLFIQTKLQESQEDIKNGRVMTVEESKERMREKYKNFNVR